MNSAEKISIHSIEHDANSAIRNSDMEDGLLTLFSPMGSIGVTIIEQLPEIITQLSDVLTERMTDMPSIKNRKKESINVSARIHAALLGRSVSIPFQSHRLCLLPNESPVIVDFEPVSRRIEYIIQIVGENASAANEQQVDPRMMMG